MLLAHTLAWTLYEIATHPEVEKRVIEEVDSVLGGADPSWADLGMLKYIGNVIKETLRLHPPVPVTSRLVAEDTQIGEFTLKKGNIVNIMIHSLHLREDIWPDATRFNPDRFQDEAASNRHPYAWMPFQMRERNCIGMNFAQLEIKTAIACIYQRVVLRADTLLTPRTNGHITQRPEGLFLYVHDRDGPLAQSTPYIALPKYVAA